jgi:SAM-dependent methyltransferase
MSTETDFSVKWLNTRYPFDVAARNSEVEKAALMALPPDRDLRLLDLGAGTGNSCRYFIPKLPQNQEWLLVELNPDLIEAAKQQLVEFAKAEGYKRLPSDDGLKFKGKKTIHIRFLQHSFLHLNDVLDLSGFDLVTAGAVIDLLSTDMLEQLVQQFIGHVAPFLATINFVGLLFDQATDRDRQYAALYMQHMQRERPFGRALGAHCIPFLESWLLIRDIPFLSGASDWMIRPEDTAMHAFQLDFMEEAITEMLACPEAGEKLQEWLAQKRAASKAGQLSFRVQHFDIFIP